MEDRVVKPFGHNITYGQTLPLDVEDPIPVRHSSACH